MIRGAITKARTFRWMYFMFFLFFFIYVAWRHRYHWFLFPMLEIQENPLTYTEYFFPNGMGSWKYDPLENREDGGEEKDIMVYFNGNAGNCSTRTPSIRIVQTLFPTFHIFHLEYPGFGISSHLSCSWPLLLQYCREACESIRQTHHIKRLMYWGESIGALVARHVVSFVEPDWYVSVNGVQDGSRLLEFHVFWGFHLFLKPWVQVFSEKDRLVNISRRVRWVFFHATEDRLVPPSQSMTRALELLEQGHECYYETLHGDHNMALLINENQDILRRFFHQKMSG